VYPHQKNESSGLPTQKCVKQKFGEGNAAKFTPDVGILPVLRPPVEPWGGAYKKFDGTCAIRAENG